MVQGLTLSAPASAACAHHNVALDQLNCGFAQLKLWPSGNADEEIGQLS